MNCRDVRDMADSFLSEELLTETNHEILRHLDTCPPCRAELDARRRLRAALRTAFDRAPELQPSDAFRNRLRDALRERSEHAVRPSRFSRGWLALAASAVLAIGAAAAVALMTRSAAPVEALARDAIGDHQNCALTFRLSSRPVPLEDAAQKFDAAYRVLVNAPPDTIPTADGIARVIERHSCVYDARRFGHVVMRYHGRVVSLLMTADDAGPGGIGGDAAPHVIGRPVKGLSVMSVAGAHHALLLVGNLNDAELAELSRAVSVPLARRLDVGVRLDRGLLASLTFEPSSRR
jgi:hypothetical protein